VIRRVGQRSEDIGLLRWTRGCLRDRGCIVSKSASPELRLDMSECPEGRELKGTQGHTGKVRGVNEGLFKVDIRTGVVLLHRVLFILEGCATHDGDHRT